MVGLAKRLASFFEVRQSAPEVITVESLMREILHQRSATARKRIVAETNNAAKILLKRNILLVPVYKDRKTNGTLIAGYVIATERTHDAVIRTLRHYHKINRSRDEILSKQIEVATSLGLLTAGETVLTLTN